MKRIEEVTKAKEEAGQPVGKSSEQLKKERVQRQYDRKVSLSRLAVRIGSIARDITYKMKQIETGIITETRSIHKLPDGTAAIVDGYVDELKPKFIIENEVDYLKNEMDLIKEQIEETKKSMEEDK